jgi:hypothetical protein
VGARAGLTDVVKRKFLTLPGLELQPLAPPARNYAIPAHVKGYIYIYIYETNEHEFQDGV